MAMNNLVSVIIPTYNSAKYIAEAIDSVLAQTYENFEIITIDDGSTDNTEEMLKPYMGKITYIRKENGGPASARNRGIEISKGEFIAFLDADDVWLPQKLEKQMNFMRNNPDIDIICTAVSDYRDSENLSSGEITLLKKGYIFNQLIQGNFITASTVLLKAKCIKYGELFDEDKRLISVEDYNLWLRLSRKYKFGFLNEVTTKRRLHSLSLSWSFEKMFEADIFNLKKLKEQFPQWRLKKNPCYWQGLANYRYKFGKEYFYFGRYFEARRQFFRSFKISPFRIKTLFWLAISLLPSSFIKKLRQYHKSKK